MTEATAGSERTELEAQLGELFARLSREPDFDAPELQAFDAADELLLTTAAEAVQVAGPGEVVVIGDHHGALTLGAAAVLSAAAIRTHQDPLLGERALARNAERLGFAGSYTSHGLDAALLNGAKVVLLQLPRGLDALEEIAHAIAAFADPAVRIFAGGRLKHMTVSQNEVLGRYFSTVSAGLGRRKSRVLQASEPMQLTDAPFPHWGADRALPFELASFGATFGGAVLDHGSRLLLQTLREQPLGGSEAVTAAEAFAPRRIVDLGCGNGVLAVSAARAWPDAEVIATDQSAAAVAATRLTAEGAGVAVHAGAASRAGATSRADAASRFTVHRADALEAVPDGWADLILLNPPFHTGATVHAGVAHRLIRACYRALAADGELRLVFNSHLRYRPLVEAEIGPAHQLARDRTFTVLAARKRGLA